MTTRMQQYERAQARTRTYTTQAVVVLVLYVVLFIPGFIANEMWYREARRMEKLAGKRLPGVGALQTMRYLSWLAIILALLSVAAVIVLDLLF